MGKATAVEYVSTGLSGMGEITAYVKRSEATVLRWIREEQFPASKFGGHSWESDKVKIDNWRRDRLSAAAGG